MRLSYGWSEGGAGRDRNKSARLAALRLGAEPDLLREHAALLRIAGRDHRIVGGQVPLLTILFGGHLIVRHQMRSEEHTSELQSLMRISYAVFCLTKKKNI